MRSIRHRHTFDAFRAPAARRSGGRGSPVRVTYVAELDGQVFDDAEVAFAIDRRFGNAVERNRVRRRIRGALTQIDGERSLPHGAYLFRPSRASLHCSFDILVESVEASVDSLAARHSLAESDREADGERGTMS